MAGSMIGMAAPFIPLRVRHGHAVPASERPFIARILRARLCRRGRVSRRRAFRAPDCPRARPSAGRTSPVGRIGVVPRRTGAGGTRSMDAASRGPIIAHFLKMQVIYRNITYIFGTFLLCRAVEWPNARARQATVRCGNFEAAWCPDSEVLMISICLSAVSSVRRQKRLMVARMPSADLVQRKGRGSALTVSMWLRIACSSSWVER